MGAATHSEKAPKERAREVVFIMVACMLLVGIVGANDKDNAANLMLEICDMHGSLVLLTLSREAFLDLRRSTQRHLYRPHLVRTLLPIPHETRLAEFPLWGS